MISAPEMISVRKVRSLMFYEAMAGKTMPGKPSEMATGTSEMATGTSEMATASTEMAAAATEASTMAAASSTMATAASTASSTMCERGGWRERQDAGQNQTGE
jgi:hypothetical protein